MTAEVMETEPFENSSRQREQLLRLLAAVTQVMHAI